MGKRAKTRCGVTTKSGKPCKGHVVPGQSFCKHHAAMYRAQFGESRAKTLRWMPYSEYLKTGHWKRLRAAKRVEGHGQCELCGSTERLNVHHRTYARRGCEKMEDLILVCTACHRTHHKGSDAAFAPWGGATNATNPMKA